MLMVGCAHSACKKLFALSSTHLKSAHAPSCKIKWIFLTLFFGASSVYAAVLPEDRADLLYHSYDGGGAEISGPSLLVRKKFGEHISTSE